MQRGDTLVEVLVAMAILAMVIVGSSVLVNGGLGAARNAVEHTQVRNSIQQQSELLHFLRDNQVEGGTDTTSVLWRQLIDTSSDIANAIPVSSLASSCVPLSAPNGGAAVKTSGKGAYSLSVTSTGVISKVDLPTVSRSPQAATPGQGLWIEGVLSPSTVAQKYIDFTIRACWTGLGDTGLQQMGSVTRLYIP